MIRSLIDTPCLPGEDRSARMWRILTACAIAHWTLKDVLALADKRLRVGRRERVVLESGRMGTTGSFHRAAVADAPFDAAPAIVWADIMGIDDSGVLVCRMARDRGC